MNFFYLLYRAGALWVTTGAGYFSAAFSYYAPLALIPLLFFTLSVTGFIYGEEFVGEVFAGWGSVLGSELVEIITTALDNFNSETASSRVPFIAGLFFLGFYIVALNVLSDGFNSLWASETSGFQAFLIKTIRAIGFLLILQIYLVLVIAMSFFVIPVFFKASSLISTIFFFASTTTFLTLLYRFLVSKSPSWRACMIGAMVSSLFVVLIKTIVDIYVLTTPVLHLYGSAGLILMLFVWTYVLAALINYGAAVAGLYDKDTRLL